MPTPQTPTTSAPGLWPDGVVCAKGFMALPDDGPGRTVVFTRRFEPGTTLTVVALCAGCAWLGYLLLGLDFDSATTTAKTAYFAAVGAVTLGLFLRLHTPWRVRIERDGVVLWGWTSRRAIGIDKAPSSLMGMGCRAVAETRARARREGLHRSQLAVSEWLWYTEAGRRHRDDQAHAGLEGDRPPFEVFAVSADRVRFVGDEVWSSRRHSMTRAGTTFEWQLRPRTLRRAGPDADLVMVQRTWNMKNQYFEYALDRTIHLASPDDDVAAIRSAISAAGGSIDVD